MADLKYPIGPFKPDQPWNMKKAEQWIEDIKEFPSLLSLLIQPLTEKQLDTPYREDGWTVKELIHHLAESHMHSYIRMKWALAEPGTTIKTYDQEKWARFNDYKAPVMVSLVLLTALHKRWGILLDGLKEEDMEIEYMHPESGKKNIWWHLDHYAWHGNHHMGHISSLIERKGWKNR